MQDALAKVTGVTEVVSVSEVENKAVVKVEKGKVETADLVAAVEGIEEVDGKPRFPAKASE
ncbi:hypothetical protein JT359_14955 [Candidatus Poribacteria bacterium]|nr:hypothetical protein [Candidatus Poribacteria bacterium]